MNNFNRLETAQKRSKAPVIKKMRIDEQYELYWTPLKGARYKVELNDTHNFASYSDTVSAEVFNDMRNKPEKYV